VIFRSNDFMGSCHPSFDGWRSIVFSCTIRWLIWLKLPNCGGLSPEHGETRITD
jgi:hypothetical protein